MNPIKFLALVAFGYFGLVVVFGSSPQSSPPIVNPVPRTVHMLPLTHEQETDRQIAIAEQMADENVTMYDETTTSLSEPSTSLVQLAQIYPDTKCQEWLPLAVEMGWPNDSKVLQTLSQVLWKESRCMPAAVSSGGDHGLTQINQIHEEWLAEMGWTLDDMAIPSSNLRFAFLLWNSREEQGLCGWQPWSISC